MSKRSLIALIILAILGAGVIIGYTMWNKPFKDPLKGDAIKVTAVQLFNDFSTNETAAQKKYVPEKVGEKKVEVSGQIKEIGKNSDGEIYYSLKTNDEMFSVKCIMDKGEEIADSKIGNLITVRGFCDGINMDVIVNRCKPLN
ncbi:MAG: OB-fold putative lipoprotein [Bacteroidota bacterium]|nr:OB-fold putative lipoprotein [Bacteroidota bacterium]